MTSQVARDDSHRFITDNLSNMTLAPAGTQTVTLSYDEIFPLTDAAVCTEVHPVSAGGCADGVCCKVSISMYTITDAIIMTARVNNRKADGNPQFWRCEQEIQVPGVTNTEPTGEEIAAEILHGESVGDMCTTGSTDQCGDNFCVQVSGVKGECRECTQDDHCAVVCYNNECKECTQHNHCAAPKPVCHHTECKECSTDDHCEGDLGYCVDNKCAECSTDNHCNGGGRFCSIGYCLAECDIAECDIAEAECDCAVNSDSGYPECVEGKVGNGTFCYVDCLNDGDDACQDPDSKCSELVNRDPKRAKGCVCNDNYVTNDGGVTCVVHFGCTIGNALCSSSSPDGYGDSGECPSGYYGDGFDCLLKKNNGEDCSGYNKECLSNVCRWGTCQPCQSTVQCLPLSCDLTDSKVCVNSN